MNLSILHVLSPFVTVCQDGIGDSELSFAALDRWLVQNGHRSITVASQDSQVAGIHVRTPVASGPLSRADREEILRRHRRNIERTLERERVDLIHLHCRDYRDYLPVTAIPTVVTEAHAPAPSRTKLHALGLKAPRPVEITDARRITAWRLPAAVSPAAVPFPRSQEHAFALCLAPVAPGSGCHVVLKAAKRAGVPVRLAGRVAPDRRSLRYHLKQILPRLDCDRRFVGSVDAALRRTLMEQALCLVLPPSGGDFNLLIAEALAAGAPVISFDPHAADGLIEPGVTGYFVRNENELVKALQKAAQLNRMACLRRAAELRSLEGMLQECLKLYLGLLPPAIFAAAS